VRVELWVERLPGDHYPILHKVYKTPVGDLSVQVRKTEDWTHGNAIPLMDDFQIPRAVKPLIQTAADVEVLRYLLIPPTAEDVAAFKAEAAHASAFSQQQGVMIAGGWGVCADMVGWLCGLQEMVLMAIDQPELLGRLMDVINSWNESRMKVILEGGVDLFIRRAWYESTQFWSPALYRKFLLPRLQREVNLAHEYGIPFGYIMTAGMLSLSDPILASGVDVLIGIDPLQQGANPLATIRQRLGGKVCLWGGVNGAITVEEGRPEEVRIAVKQALETMRGCNGFILSPVDNITEITPNAWRNVNVLVEVWKELR
jgi:uroporphyrinogen-III decarboxylase